MKFLGQMQNLLNRIRESEGSEWDVGAAPRPVEARSAREIVSRAEEDAILDAGVAQDEAKAPTAPLTFGARDDEAPARRSEASEPIVAEDITHDDEDDDHHGDDVPGIFADHLMHDHDVHDHGGGAPQAGGAEEAAPVGDKPPIGDLDNLMDYLHDVDHDDAKADTWPDDGGGVVLRVGFPQSVNDIPEDHLAQWNWVDPSDEGLDAFTAFDATRRAYAEEALALWSDVVDITFEIVAPGAEADIYMFGREYEDGGGYSSGVQTELGSAIRINTATGSSWWSMQPGEGGFSTLVHEIGHSIGLTHPGDYDVGSYTSYDVDALYLEDTKMYSIMSYNGGSNTGFATGGLEGSTDTPRGHDLYVAQKLYGANWSTRSSDTTYGFNTTETGGLFDFDELAARNDFIANVNAVTNANLPQYGPVITIWDGGGANDWLDLSGDANDVTLDLTPGAFSSTHGMTNNISLAYHPNDGAGQYAHYIENARGGSGDDTIRGNELDNELEGGSGDDVIHGLHGDDDIDGGLDDDALYGGHGEDTLVGGGGDDTISGGYGVDLLNGGGGSDTADYSYSNVDWDIDLGYAPNQSASNASGSEILSYFESAVTGDGDDSIEGSSADNRLDGNGGDDTLRGFEGDDTLIGDDGDDDLWGGDDADTLYGGEGGDRLEGGEGADWLEGGADSDWIYGGGGSDQIWSDIYSWTNPNLAGDDTIYASSGDDTVVSAGGDDYINAGIGDDSVRAEHGDDTIIGGDGDDEIFGGYGDDVISGGYGLDDLFGGSGLDELDLTDIAEDWYVNLLNDTAQFEGQGGVDNIDSFEIVRAGAGADTIVGTHGADTVFGGGGADDIEGNWGDDLLLGDGGNDRLWGDQGDDLISGGSGYDTADYDGASAGVVVDLALNGVGQMTGGAGEDTLISIERVDGSGHADVLAGNAAANWVRGGGGGDVLFGREGNDWVHGGDGDDIVEGGDGDDILTGGDGEDAASYFFASSGVIVDLNDHGSQNTLGAGSDVITSVEHLIGSFHSDWLTGDEASNRLTAGAGNDIMSGGAGSDSLYGGEGNDVLNGGLGNDVIDGGSGIDWAYFTTDAPNGVEVDLSAGEQWTKIGTDLIVNIENVLGSRADDDIRGDEGANELNGSGGDDTIFGAAGDDTITGGTGDDVIYVGMDEPYEAPGGLKLEGPAEDRAIADSFIFERLDPGVDPVASLRLAAADGGSAPASSSSRLASGSSGEFMAISASAVEATLTNRAGGAQTQAIGGVKIEPGSGADVVRFASGWGDDEIFGFTAGVDKLDFSAISSLDLIDLDIDDVASGTLITYGANSVLLRDVEQDELTDGDFLL